MLNVPLAPAAFTAYKDFLSDAKAFGFHLNFRRVLLDAGAAAALFIRIEERASNALLQADIVRAGHRQAPVGPSGWSGGAHRG